MEGYKHLIDCHCVLPQYRSVENPIFHKFVVFSQLDESGGVIPKLVRCENCGAVHKVIDICKSEIMVSKEESRNVMSKSDVATSLPSDLVKLLEDYQLGLADFELAKFIIDNERWGDSIILSKEKEDDGFTGKVLKFISPTKFRVDPFFDKDTF